ncbi:hydroxyacylglutathione hydrolase [Pseudomonas sp. MYb185]|uniref:hydroxyacylglutathione hydrolase n=1 Tax=Pseudomonas sp. MYb185 TaxID=1848729 RepID=UPI000CFC5F3D|nr:hydroxyacylglutathione hydrolase [Pseudomonas sp. MYb185]PRB81618.1 hydroxyacylglutathione hydrolase [Pseudomonas sp. MYb185]
MPTFIALPAFQDNYIWLLQDHSTLQVTAVDPGDARPVITWLSRHPEYQLNTILLTHHHRDHTGGVLTLKAATGCKVWGPANDSIQGIDRPLAEGYQLRLYEQEIEVLAVPGHTLDHIAFFCNDPQEPWLLSGDTLFAGGCGRLFEGTPEQMYASLQRLASLPDNTTIYCTHEYTQSNLRFAQAVEPNNPDIQVRLEVVDELRRDGRITLPTTLALEKRTNPFLRCEEPHVVGAAAAHSGAVSAPGVQTFAAIRAWKDTF